jgi:four helix bundle protein
VHDYRRLEVWRRADDLTVEVYKLTERFPTSEQFELTSQIRRAAYSIPTNIAEGAGRRSNRDFARFIDISIGSSTELEYQLHLANRLGYIEPPDQLCLTARLGEIRGMLRRLADWLRSQA